MTALDTNALIEQLRQACDAVLEAIIANRADQVEQLVVDQCRLVRRINAGSVTEEQKTRLAELAKMAQQQQLLIGQALEVSEYFLRRLNESRSFNNFG